MTTAHPQTRAKVHLCAQDYCRIAGTKRNRDGDPTESSQSFRRVGLQEFTCDHLRAVCRQKGIENYSRMDKRTLLIVVGNELLVKQEALFDARRNIVAWPAKPINDTDPILMTDLTSRGPQYTFTLHTDDQATPSTKQRMAYRFDPVSLVEMILQTGHTTNPYNRQQLTPDQLLRLEHVYVSCLRAHPEAPRDKKRIISKRPDMNVHEIARIPKRKDLAIDDNEEEMPGPVMGFAPWLCSDTLEVFARRRKILVDNEREHEQTRLFLRARVDEAFRCIESLFQPLKIPFTDRQADTMLQTCLQVQLPMLLETMDELVSFACSEMRSVLPSMVLVLLNVKCGAAEVPIRSLAAWILGMLLDDLTDQCRDLGAGLATNGDIRWLSAFVLEMCSVHSTAALVKSSATLSLLCLTLDV